MPFPGSLVKYEKNGVLQMAEQVMRKEHEGLEQALGPRSFCSLLKQKKMSFPPGVPKALGGGQGNAATSRKGIRQGKRDTH